MEKGDKIYIPYDADGKPYRIATDGYIFMDHAPNTECGIFRGCTVEEYVPLKTAFWLVVKSKNPTSVTVHRCSNPECRLTTYAHRLPPYCQECGSKMLGKAREEDDKYILQS